jgi:WD40 repeat protein
VFPYLLRLTLWLALPITLLSLLMPALGQMNPRRDWIVYASGQSGQEGVTLHDLERHFSTSVPVAIIPDYGMDFSTQGRLTYAVGANGQNQVRVFDVRSSVNNPQVIYTAPNSTRFYRFKWSPDERYLAFPQQDENRNTYLYVWDGESILRINHAEADTIIEGIAWSYDNRLAFTVRPSDHQAGRSFPSELYLWDGQQTINVSQTPEREERLGPWSQDGRLAYISLGFTSDDPNTVIIWDGLNSTQVYSDVGTLYWLGWNAEDELTFTRLRNDISQLYRWDGTKLIDISPDSQAIYGYYDWNMDGRWAVNVRKLPEVPTNNIQVWDTDQQLLLDVADATYPLWTEAGSLLFCQRQSQGVVLQHWDGERTRPITQGSIIYALVPGSGILYCD